MYGFESQCIAYIILYILTIAYISYRKMLMQYTNIKDELLKKTFLILKTFRKHF